MFSLQPQYTILWSRRNLLTWLPTAALALALSLSVGACHSADDDMLAPNSDPAEEPAAAPNGIAPSENTAALSTTQRILFMSYQGSAPMITKVDPQGASRAPVVSADYESTAAWSWDNKRIALVRQRTVGNTSTNDIYLVKADGTNGHWASATPSPWPVMDPSWSPNGSRLVVRALVQNTAYLAWMDVATGQITFINGLQGGVVGSRPSYNAAGTKIIYMGPAYKTIEQINADGSNHKVRFSSATLVADPSFSPAGNKIAFSRRIAGTSNDEIFVKNFADGTLKRLTNNGAYDTHPTWSPDGTRIAFTSNRSGTQQIWTMNATTGGNPTRITHTKYWESEPAWSH